MHKRQLTFLSVIIPAYNEGARIQSALQTVGSYLKKFPFRWEILVVDDGSQDDTALKVKSFFQQMPEVRLMSNSRNSGKGAAICEGWKAAGGEAILFYDTDGATSIEELPGFIPFYCEGADLISGSRHLPGSKIVVKQNYARRFFGTGYRILNRFILGTEVSDITCGFKLVSRKAAEIFVPRMRIRRWAFDAEMFVIARKHHLVVVEVPVRWSDKRKTKVRIFQDVVRSFSDTVRIFFLALSGKYR